MITSWSQRKRKEKVRDHGMHFQGSIGMAVVSPAGLSIVFFGHIHSPVLYKTWTAVVLDSPHFRTGL